MRFLSARIPFIEIPTAEGPQTLYLVTKQINEGTLVQVRMGPRLIGTLGITNTPSLLRPQALKQSRFIEKYLKRYFLKMMAEANIVPFEPNTELPPVDQMEGAPG